MRAALIQPSWSSSSQWGAEQAKQQFAILQGELDRVFDVQSQPAPAHASTPRDQRTVGKRAITQGRSRIILGRVVQQNVYMESRRLEVATNGLQLALFFFLMQLCFQMMV